MRRRGKARRSGRSAATWITGVVVVLGAAAFAVSALPSTRRYLRMRAM